MSDEGLTNLEDDDGSQSAIQENAEQVTEARTDAQDAAGQAAEAPPETPAEVDEVKVGESRYVPLKAVQEARQKEKAASQAARQAQEQFQQLQQQYQQIAPFAQILRDNPDLLRPRESVKPTAAEPSDDPDLVAFAQALDLYDPQTGKPDTKKAALVVNVTEKRAEAKAQAAVQPFQTQQLMAAAQANYQSALNLKLPNGQPIDKAVFDDLWRQAANEPGALHTLSNQQSVAALALIAAGAASFQQRAPQAQAPNAPLITETSGGVPRARPYLSNIEAKIAKDRGVSDSQWAKNTAGFNKGAANTLED